MTLSEICNKLKEIRKESGLSIKWVAKQTKLAPQTVCNLLNGKVKNPTLSNLNKIAKCIGYNLTFDLDLFQK